MNTSVTKARVYEFDFPTLGTLLRVEESDGAVVVRATRDTFTDERKSRFIRELVAEGFGIVTSTFSAIFIAAQVFYWWHKGDRQHVESHHDITPKYEWTGASKASR